NLVPVFSRLHFTQEISLDLAGFMLKIILDHRIAWLGAVRLFIWLSAKPDTEHKDKDRAGWPDPQIGPSPSFRGVHGLGRMLVLVWSIPPAVEWKRRLVSRESRSATVIRNDKTAAWLEESR